MEENDCIGGDGFCNYATLSYTINSHAPSPTLYSILIIVATSGDDNGHD